MNSFINTNQIRKTLNILRPNSLFEIRILQGKGRSLSGYFRDIEQAVKAMENLTDHDLRGANVYITLNEILGDCYARMQKDRIIVPAETTQDAEIIGYDWLFVDLDPVRPKGTSSSNEQLREAKERAKKVYAFLKQEGFEEPVIGMSGNGYHLLYPVSLTADKKETVKKFLEALDMLFSDEVIKIDTVNFNPSRICKLYGTLAQKGTGTDDRPHRMAYMVQAPEQIKPVKLAYIEKIGAMLPKPERPQAYNQYNPQRFDIVEWMVRYGIAYTKKDSGDYTKYVLAECPFDHNHKAPDSMITVGRSGAIGFKCLHNSCRDKTWKDVRMMYEPHAYDQREEDRHIDDGWNQHKLYNRTKAIDYQVSEEEPEEEGKPVFLTAQQILDMPTETEDFIRTGIEGIDNRMRGLKKGAVSLLSGLRGGSKSTLLTQIALNAVNDGHNVTCYSGELTSRNFMRWMNLQAAGKAHVQQTKYNNYYVVARADLQKIARWLGEHFQLYNNDYGNNYERLYARLKNQIAVQKTDLIILDNLMALDIRDLDNRDKYSAQKIFIESLTRLAKQTDTHIIFVAHPRKAVGFLRLDDVSGSADLANLTDNAFIVHRNNADFKRLSKDMFKWKDDHIAFTGTNVIEIAKDRDMGTQDVFIPLWYEPETKRLKNSEAESIVYGWLPDEFDAVDLDDIPF